MKIFIASDHRGVGLKLYLVEMLTASGFDVANLGVDDPNTMVDYPDVAQTLADAMAEADTESRGILICGTGAGMIIAANRYHHIRATRCDNPDQARNDRFHDDVNVMCFGADDIDIEVAFLTAREFLDAPFDAIERRVRRIQKIS